MDDPIELETDAEVADCVAAAFGSRELRRLASNLGVSRERGDTKRQTAERIVAQDPATAARVVENDREVDMDASAFRERRETGDGPIGVAEARRRARHDGMKRRMRDLERLEDEVPHYDFEVNWEYGASPSGDGWEPGLTSVHITTEADVHPLVRGRAHAILTPRGAARHLKADGAQYVEPGRRAGAAWRMFRDRVGRFYEP